MTAPFTVRGVVEGFYGRPWAHAQRLDLVNFISSRGMNTFMYAPKDDPFLRSRWREAHTGASLEQFTELLQACCGAGIRFVPCLSPGLSIEYSSPADRATLITKYAEWCDAGIDAVGLLLDDIPLRLQHPEDKAAFSSLAEAHVDLIGEVYAELPQGTELFVCPTQYYGRGDEDYISRLGNVDPRIQVMWTGREICSPFLDLADAAVVARSLHRRVTYWDNFPVNDVAMTHELHIGPYAGRDPDLARFAHGVIVNAMEYYESSKPGIAAAAAYLAEPVSYDVEAAWREAVRQVAHDAVDRLDAPPFTTEQFTCAYELFADNCRMSPVYATDAHILTQALEEYLFGAEYGDREAARAAFLLVAARFEEAAGVLDAAVALGIPLAVEVREWIQAFGTGSSALRHIPDAFEHHDTAALDRLAEFQRELRAGRRRVFGDVLDMTMTDLLTDREFPKE